MALVLTIFSLGVASRSASATGKPFLESELIFPLEHWHNHASCIVETANGDLLVCWFHGSGERTADDVKISNDTERGRNSLAVAVSDDEGLTWKWKRRLEYDPPGEEAGSYHYPSIIQARDGTLHASYSYHLNRKDLEQDAEGQPRRKAIKHAHFNEEWVMAGEK